MLTALSTKALSLLCIIIHKYDNAHMESYFGRFKAELMEGGAFESAEDSRTEIFEYIEMYYNPKRLHSSLGYLSPNVFEQKLAT
ncbi:IS3 family transposase [Chitinophaga tropicalis]|uniref:IS3 family transposase n=1 Tax=Chitinophaga tropicalis TaxID=2683588 RepID=A0A7K1U5M6_9BACT|nr:IS3 family transposase [Chitinophaga tropicalis]MVT09672.1 IS3 family transposase [Chitinophaga tropicalis]